MLKYVLFLSAMCLTSCKCGSDAPSLDASIDASPEAPDAALWPDGSCRPCRSIDIDAGATTEAPRFYQIIENAIKVKAN